MSHFVSRFARKFHNVALLLPLAAGACAVGPDNQWPPAPRLSHAPIASCFAEAESDVNLASIVHIVVATRDGVAVRGTGFVVRDSQGSDGLARVLTAGHVVAAALESPGRVGIHVTLSDGRVIGQARLTAMAQPWSAAQRDDASLRDLAVLQVVPTDAAAAQAWRHIAGLPLAGRQRADSILRGRIAEPVGPDVGASGSPVLDRAGRVVGVLTKVQALDPVGVRIAAADIGARISGGPDTPATLPRSSIVIADPVSAAPVLVALGAAGRGIDTAPGGARLGDAPVTTAGFPRRLCISFRGTMGEAPLPPSAAALERVRLAFSAASL